MKLYTSTSINFTRKRIAQYKDLHEEFYPSSQPSLIMCRAGTAALFNFTSLERFLIKTSERAGASK